MLPGLNETIYDPKNGFFSPAIAVKSCNIDTKNDKMKTNNDIKTNIHLNIIPNFAH